MVPVQNGIKFGFFLFLINIIVSDAAWRANRNSEFLDKLLNVKRQAPVVVFLEQSRDGLKITDIGQDIENSQQIENARENQDLDERANNDNKDLKYVPSRSEEDAYVLYSILRSTQEEEQLDINAENVIKTTKDILRQAFALRCQARQSCEKKCPQKCRTECEETTKKPCPKKRTTTKKPCRTVCKPKPSPCTNKCKKVYDELDACDSEPEEEEESPCDGGCGGGRTKPPKWLRSLLQQRL